MGSLAVIRFTLIGPGHDDDFLTIEPDPDSNGYFATFDQQTVGNYVTIPLTNNELIPYLTRFFEAIQYDWSSCTEIQCDCPAYPSVSLPQKSMGGYVYHTLQQQVMFLQTCWPTEEFPETIRVFDKRTGLWSSKPRFPLHDAASDGEPEVVSTSRHLKFPE